MIHKFHDRLEKIGIKTTFLANYPWIYLDTVNGVKVETRFQANHGFTAFVQSAQRIRFSNRKVVFDEIRKMIST